MGTTNGPPPSTQELAINTRIETYRPTVMDAATWARLGPFCRAAVIETHPAEPHKAVNILGFVARLALFCDRQGLPLDREVVFAHDTIERFVLTYPIPVGHGRGTRANARSALRRVAYAVLDPRLVYDRPGQLPPDKPETPYTAAEQRTLLDLVGGQPTELRRHNLEVLLRGGMGFGLGAVDFRHVRGADIERRHGVVVCQVSGTRPRCTVALAEHEDRLLSLAEAVGDGPLFRRPDIERSPNLITNFVANLSGIKGAPRLNSWRLRATWVCHHLAVGTPLPILVPALGTQAYTLARYLPYVECPKGDDSLAVLRGPS